MKISQFNLNILLDEVDALCQMQKPLKEAAQEWLKHQKSREVYGSSDQYWTALARTKLERELIEFREKLAMVYDFMGDRGLVEFQPTGWGVQLDGTEQEQQV